MSKSIQYYFDKVRAMVDTIVKNELTIGFEDVGIPPYNDAQISEFIQSNSDQFDECIREMVNQYEEDNDIYELENPCYDWILEYLHTTPCMIEILEYRDENEVP